MLHENIMKSVFKFLYLLNFMAFSMGARILLYPVDHTAHVHFQSVIGAELLSRGHQVDMLVSEKSVKIPQKHGLGTVVVSQDEYMDIHSYEQAASSTTTLEKLASVQIIAHIALVHARKVLGDASLIEQLRDNSYDLCLIEGYDMARIMYVLPYKLGIKYISLQVRPDAWNDRVSALPSVEGFFPVFVLDENSTFSERLANTITYAFVQAFATPPSLVSGLHDSLLDEFVPEKPNIGLEKLYHDSEMTLILQDPICTDQHRISAPHFQFIGGLGAHDGDPLPDNLQKFVDGAQEGVIVFTLGSGLKRLPDSMMHKVLPVFAKLKQRVIMRHDGDMPRNVPKNVLIQSWLPQNDLLANDKTRVFITHCGNNGQLEAVYHGVPMLLMPLWGDQEYNALRVEKRQYGVRIDAHGFTSQEFDAALSELLNNPVYTSKIKKCSAILHSLPSPKHTAAFWIEHVLRFGGDHLKPYYRDMPLYQFFLCDVILFLVVVDVIVVYALYRCVRCCCCRKTVSKKKKE